MNKDDFEIASKVLASKHRTNILIELLEGPKTPTELANSFEEHQPTISRALSELKKLKLVESTSQARGRLYWITEEMEHIATYIRDREK
jgi:predicted transcriptional regulator